VIVHKELDELKGILEKVMSAVSVNPHIEKALLEKLQDAIDNGLLATSITHKLNSEVVKHD
jgi:hypothetical protein